MKLLLVEDNPADARLICEMLKDSRAGEFQVQQATRLRAALELLRQEIFDVVLLDLSLPDSNGLETLAGAQRASAGLPILVLTGLDDERFALEAVRAGAQDYLVKGQFDPELLVRAIRYAIQRKQAEEEIRRLNADLERRVAERTSQFQTANRELLNEIDERKRAEEALRQSLERLNKLLDVQAVGVMIWDLNTGCMIDANDTFLRLMGYSRSEVEARELSWQKLTPPEYMDVSRAEVEKFLATGRVGPYEKEYFRKDGTRQWLLFSGSSLGNNQCVEYCVDISDRKQAEEALRQTEAQFRTLANAIPQLCWMANTDGWIFWYNERWYEYTGTTPEQMEGWGWQSVHDPETLPSVLERWKGSITTGLQFDMVFPLRGADGVLRPFLTRVVPIKNTDGKVVRWFGTNTDVTELRNSQRALDQAKQVAETNMAQMRTTLDNLAEAVYVCDAAGRPLITNPAFRRLTGHDAGALPRNYEDITVQFPLFELDGRCVDCADRPVSAALRGEIVSGRELRLGGQPSGDKILRFNAAPVRDAQGNIIMAVLSIEDITASKQAEAALIRSEKLAATGRMAATIAHEVNNPLSAALNAVYLASSDPTLTQQTRELLNLADQELRRAGHITQQTLGYYRENGTRVPVALPKLIDEVLAVYARKLKERCITVHRRYKCGPCRDGCETCFLVNSGELRQIISNLFANGMDALADNGTLRIHVSRLSGLGSSGPLIQITMADNGCGIRAENLKRIFEPFFTTKQSLGTGLGLWVTHELVRKHNGSIKVRSQERKGTVFRVLIPATAAASRTIVKIEGTSDNQVA